jgi:hypothetical protein
VGGESRFLTGDRIDQVGATCFLAGDRRDPIGDPRDQLYKTRCMTRVASDQLYNSR